MRISRVCLSSISVLAASLASGCSSDNATSAGDSGGDVRTIADAAATTDAPADTSTTDSASDSGDAGRDDSSACMPLDASVETVAAGRQWACYQAACASQLTACAADCICNDAILGALLCAAVGGDSTTCFTNSAVQTNAESGVIAVLACLRTNTGTCGATDGGGEAGKDGGAEGGTEGGGDAALTDALSGG